MRLPSILSNESSSTSRTNYNPQDFAHTHDIHIQDSADVHIHIFAKSCICVCEILCMIHICRILYMYVCANSWLKSPKPKVPDYGLGLVIGCPRFPDPTCIRPLSFPSCPLPLFPWTRSDLIQATAQANHQDDRRSPPSPGVYSFN